MTVLPGCEPNAQVYKMDDCLIVVGSSDECGWHITISKPADYPTFQEVTTAIHELVPSSVDMAIIPPYPEQAENGLYIISAWEVNVKTSRPVVYIRPPSKDIL